LKRAALLLLLTACAPERAEPSFGFSVLLSRATADLLTSFQVSVLANGSQYDCNRVQLACVKSQVPSGGLVPVIDPTRGEARAAIFPMALSPGDAGVPAAQQVVLQGITAGTDYAVVIEGISRTSPPRLVGSSCNYLRELRRGENPPLVSAVIPAPPAQGFISDCDPRLETP
jgi:hypothetical protein